MMTVCSYNDRVAGVAAMATFIQQRSKMVMVQARTVGACWVWLCRE